MRQCLCGQQVSRKLPVAGGARAARAGQVTAAGGGPAWAAKAWEKWQGQVMLSQSGAGA